MKKLTYKYYKEHLLDKITDEDKNILKFIKNKKHNINKTEKCILDKLKDI